MRLNDQFADPDLRLQRSATTTKNDYDCPGHSTKISRKYPLTNFVAFGQGQVGSTRRLVKLNSG